MKGQQLSAEYTPEQRREMLQKMQAVANQFYKGAVFTGVHAFVEFCGLMNEFIKVCLDAETKDIDFTMANTHSGRALPFEEWHGKYLAEKLNCIYGPALLSNKKVRDVFIMELFGGEYYLVEDGPSDE